MKAFDAPLLCTAAKPVQGQLSSVAQWCETNKWLRQASTILPHTRCAVSGKTLRVDVSRRIAPERPQCALAQLWHR